MKKKAQNTTGNNANTVLPPVVSLEYSKKLAIKKVFEKDNCQFKWEKQTHSSVYNLTQKNYVVCGYAAPTKSELLIKMTELNIEMLSEGYVALGIEINNCIS